MPITTTKCKFGKNENTVVVILGATKASRMGNFGAKLGIVMPDNQTLLHHEIDFVQHIWNPSEIYISIGYDADRVISKRPSGIRFIENNRWEETGEVEELRLILNCCNPDKLIIMCGDIYLSNYGVLPQICESYSLSMNGNDINQIGIKQENGYLNMFSFSFNSKFLGIVQLLGNELSFFRKLISRDRNKLALWELIEIYIKQGYKLKNIELNTKKLVKINTVKDLSFIRNCGGIL